MILWYFFIFCRLAEGLPFGQVAALYNSSDPITQLNTINFKQTVLATSNAWLIEFYSSWCGHCIDFAPHFRTLANDVKDWETVIKIGAVDCAKDENSPVCREYEVMAYPTLKFFPAFSTSTQLGITRQGPKKVDSIRQSMIGFIEDQFKEKSAASHWPILSLLGNETMDELWIHHYDHKTLILLFEAETETEQFWSREFILDFFPHKGYPPMRRIGKSRQDLIDQFKIKSFPSVVIIDKPNQFDKFDINPDRKLAGKFLREILHPEIEQETKKPSLQSDSGKDLQVFKPRNNQVYMTDLERAILYSLGHEVTLHKVISKKHFRALENYLKVLHTYFPGRRKVKDIIQVAKNGLSKYGGHIKGEEFAKLWDDAIDSEHPNWREEIPEWMGCQGSKPHFRGYPCSLWSLWHTLTVSFALSKDEVSIANPRLIMETMKGYIQYFFGCSHCSNHFVDMAENEEDPIEKIDSANRSVLWLWSAHNKVNRRLSGDLTEDPRAPKVQFPSPDMCNNCQIDRNWSDAAVIKYLMRFYEVSNINLEGVSADSIGAVKDSMGSDVNLRDGAINSGSVSIHSLQWTSLSLTKIDISLCASIYLISALLLILFLGKILVNRRYRKRLIGKC